MGYAPIRAGTMFLCCITAVEHRLSILGEPVAGERVRCEACGRNLVFRSGAWEGSTGPIRMVRQRDPAGKIRASRDRVDGRLTDRSFTEH